MPNFHALVPAFARAYIVPQLLDRSNTDRTANFVLNYESDGEKYIRSLYSFQNRHQPSDNWWAVYVLSAFQFSTGYDNDPDVSLSDLLRDDVHIVTGIVDHIPGEGANLFNATIADQQREFGLPNHTASNKYCIGSDDILVHEVAHAMGAKHGDGGIMDVGFFCQPAFSMKSLSRIRHIGVH